ncbi:MAG: SufD family Fe-S cluster assembly protein [Candidatus Pacebacteria bacterium]|nr:SufD family Fe-S cluster assembly protein [Candidatus Paceibacterota bacterium]
MSQKNSKTSLRKEIKGVEKVGFDILEKTRCGSFIQIDNKASYSSCRNEGVEVIPTSLALKRYSWLKKYIWKAVRKNKDEYTKEILRYKQEGYFIRAKKGVKAKIPVQACLYIKTRNIHQRVHNIIIAEEGSSLNIITGCTIAPQIYSGMHVGISEFFIKRNAAISFTMIHNWAKDTIVRPRTGAFLEENAQFISNYICLKEVKDLQMYPMAYLNGKGAVCRFSSILVAPKKTLLDVGSGVFLGAKKTRAEIIARALSKGGKIISRGKLIGEFPETKAHLECKGLILKKEGEIDAIPELEGRTIGSDLSHEAAVGKINEEEIEYLMARGVSRKDATAMIIRGFLNIDIKGLPDSLDKQIKKAINLSAKSF